LNVAVRRGYITRNPASFAKPPTVVEEEIEPYDVGDVKRLLKVARALPHNSARWDVALALGLRQGEALGLRWQDIDLDRGYFGFVEVFSGRGMSMAAMASVVVGRLLPRAPEGDGGHSAHQVDRQAPHHRAASPTRDATPRPPR
jgi:site-specific recombinase XerC